MISRGEKPPVAADKMPALLNFLGLTEQDLADAIDRAKRIQEHNQLLDDADQAAKQLPDLLKKNQEAHDAFVIAEDKAAQSLVEPEALVQQTYNEHKAADELIKRAARTQRPQPGDVDPEYENLWPDVTGASPIRKAQVSFAKSAQAYRNAMDTTNPHTDEATHQRVRALHEYWLARSEAVNKIIEQIAVQKKRLEESYCEFTGLFFPTDPPASYRVNAPDSVIRIPSDGQALAEVEQATGLTLT